MNAQSRVGGACGAAIIVVMLAAPVRGHHSFAMYDMKVTKVFTGVVTRVDPSVNHLQIFFAPMNPERTNVERGEDGKPILWTVEMAGSAQMARQGVSVNTFPPGTVFSVGLHPLRNGEPAGSREGGMFKCPERTPPAPGMHCDSVTGHTAIGGQPLPKPTE
jgi:hypothetical protein